MQLMMRVILTHEQADFDAVASQLGAWLLDRSAVPVTPNRINRNVRAFLTLYGADLPFVGRRDLPAGPVEAAVLVDTQSLVTLKGMRPNLSVQVIDHHNLREGLPDSWRIQVEPVGATTTLFVEFIRERNLPLSRVHATLLMLGIYEDTGSLTYTRTTPRDLHAAAYLMDCGASLQVVGEYLDHPLSLAQQGLLEQLRETAVSHKVHGNRIIIAQADASDIHEELSTIAHKMRDSLDPDALILLVKIAGGIQLIGRSTSDRVDVGDIAAHFGGGGHDRAAAAMIKTHDLDQVLHELVTCLPDYVRSALTVAQIMSRGGPQVLDPETTVQEALARMQRYGYEGYPVVENNRVIGLLTRRSVDRAISHKLNISARKVMEAGEVIIHPGDSLEKLQFLMTETGWGQIPVLDPDTNEILGIVTRTDLLKTLSTESSVPGRRNFAEHLREGLQPEHLELLRLIASEAHHQQNALYIVGGFVRDLLLDRPSLDFDLVVEGDAISLARALAQKNGGRVTTHRRFGTAKWLLEVDTFNLSSIDLVTARTEFYTYPTALPTVERGSIKLDLHRRDFTLNTLAIRLDGPHYGDLHDYWGGLSDLRQGKIRVLHSLSFVDDPTRMLRAVRFEQRFGFSIEDRTLELLKAAIELLQRVSGDRIRHELDYILDEPQGAKMFTRLYELDLLHTIHPDLPHDHGVLAMMFEPVQIEDPWLSAIDVSEAFWKRALAYVHWFMNVPVKKVSAITRRLKIRNSLEKIILGANRLKVDLPSIADALPSEITARLDQVDPLAIYAVWRIEKNPLVSKKLETYIQDWRHIKPSIDGHDLRTYGLAPGPAYKSILAELRRAWLNGDVNTSDEEAGMLQKLISKYS